MLPCPSLTGGLGFPVYRPLPFRWRSRDEETSFVLTCVPTAPSRRGSPVPPRDSNHPPDPSSEPRTSVVPGRPGSLGTEGRSLGTPFSPRSTVLSSPWSLFTIVPRGISDCGGVTGDRGVPVGQYKQTPVSVPLFSYSSSPHSPRPVRLKYRVGGEWKTLPWTLVRPRGPSKHGTVHHRSDSEVYVFWRIK